MKEKSEFHAVSLNETSTIVAKFIPSVKDERFYESEASLEAHFIKQLIAQGYEYASGIKDEKGLILNLKRQIERLNECEFSQNEWQRFFTQVLGKENDGIVEKTTLIQENHLHSFEFDNGASKNIMLVDKQNLQRNVLQVVSQYSVSIDCHEFANANAGFANKSYNDDKEVLNHPERIKEIVSYVLANFDKKTYRSGTYTTAQNKRIKGFNSIFASASIESAKLFYDEFKLQNSNLNEKDRFKIAIIFSYMANEDLDENIEDCEGLPKSSRDFLEGAIRDYNGIFGTNFNTSAESFGQYYVDLSSKMKNKELDMLIVVDMFLTGFDAKTLNTLWVDKNLRYHRLLQAFSRTNRILDSTKRFGNVVCFRDLEKATNESIALFSQKGDDSKVVLMRSFKDYFEGYFEESTDENGQSIREFHKGYTQIVQDLKRDFLEPQNLETLQEKKAFIKAYNELLRIENILSVFDEFSEDKVLLDERTKQNLQSAYLQIKDELMGQKDPQLQAEIEDLVFEIELIRQVDINIDFIYELLQSAKKESDKDKREKILQDIASWVDSSLKLRDKGDLIKEFSRYFIDLSDDKNEDEFSFIEREFRVFVKIKKKQELEKIIADEELNAPKTMKFIEKSFKNGEISDLGVDFREILPKSSLFAAKNT